MTSFPSPRRRCWWGDNGRARQRPVIAGERRRPSRINLRSALQLARRLSLPLPRELLIYVIAVQDPYTFGERFTPDVERALPAAASTIATGLAALFRSPSPVQT
jgi:hypothetical protein